LNIEHLLVKNAHRVFNVRETPWTATCWVLLPPLGKHACAISHT